MHDAAVTPQRIEGGSALVRAIGLVCWALVGMLVVLALLVCALATVSEVVLPLVFAVVLAVVFAPLGSRLQRRGFRPGLSALVIAFGLILTTAGAVLLAVVAVVEQTQDWSAHVDDAVLELSASTDDAGVDEAALADLREAIGGAAALIAQGLVTLLLSGIGTVVGFLAGAVLAVLILYYLLKDGPSFRAWLVGSLPPPAQAEFDALLSRSATTVRAYAAGRTALSILVAAAITAWSALIGLPMLGTIAVVNFFGGYVPYLGAVIGGGVVVVLALSTTGIAGAMVTLAVILLANLALENLVEPRLLGNRLHVHPLLVLIVTTMGGVLGGIVGLILAVPIFVVAVDAATTLRRHLITSGPPALPL
jgi:putative heme transporter